MYLENYEIQLDFNIISFSYFKHLYEINKSLNNENNQDEETLFQKTKNEIKELKHILFDKNKEIKEIMENTYMKKFFEYLEFEKEQKFDDYIFNELNVLNQIFNEFKNEDFIIKGKNK